MHKVAWYTSNTTFIFTVSFTIQTSSLVGCFLTSYTVSVFIELMTEITSLTERSLLLNRVLARFERLQETFFFHTLVFFNSQNVSTLALITRLRVVVNLTILYVLTNRNTLPVIDIVKRFTP